jgi:hypothetical protein
MEFSLFHWLLFVVITFLVFANPPDPPDLGWLLERWRK